LPANAQPGSPVSRFLRGQPARPVAGCPAGLPHPATARHQDPPGVPV